MQKDVDNNTIAVELHEKMYEDRTLRYEAAQQEANRPHPLLRDISGLVDKVPLWLIVVGVMLATALGYVMLLERSSMYDGYGPA